ncbi:MAG: hypothetical protein ABI678_28905, partial [Kofleriaceae bacterium]
MTETRWTGERVLRLLWPWLLVLAISAIVIAIAALHYHVSLRLLRHELGRVIHLAIHPEDQEGELIEWKSPRAVVLVAGAALVGTLAFHLHRRRAAAMAFSQVALVRRRGVASWLADLPAALRVAAVGALALGLA